jgi:phage gp36-like protein
MSQYASTTDLTNIGLPAQALAGVSFTIQTEHLTKASARIDSYLRAHYTLPLASPYPDEIVDACAHLAAYTLLVRRGYDPGKFDATFRLNYEDAIAYLKDLSAGRAALAVSADTTPTTNEGAPMVLTGGNDTVGGEGTAGEGRGW